MAFQKSKYPFLFLGIVLFLTVSCKVGPKYVRPSIKLDSTFRFAKLTDTNSIANVEWVKLFDDPVLQDLVRLGLKNNYDLRIAFERINEARASFKAARGEQWPQFGAQGYGSYSKTVSTGEGYTLSGVATLSWEIDLWGKLRHAKEAERAKLFAAVAYQQSVRINLIADIISGYFNLIELDNELQITNENIGIREQSLELVRAKMIAGTASGLVVAQAEAELAAAKTQVPSLEMQIGMAENALSILLGEAPNSIPRGRPLLEQVTIPSIKTPGIPSQLIVRRPDIIMAEQNLIAANANIGVARANMLPSLSISGNIGAAFDPTSLIYNAVGNLVAPIFNGGTLRANLHKSQAQKEEMLLTYQKTIIQSLQEVSDAAIQIIKDKEVVDNQKATVDATRTTFDLSNQLYNAGYASYLDVLDAQRNLFSTEINLSQYQSNQLISMISLYRALGGGWQ
jgi:NodT family efflux transporter outer membrane factor (OMF) lipoprotein